MHAWTDFHRAGRQGVYIIAMPLMLTSLFADVGDLKPSEKTA